LDKYLHIVCFDVPYPVDYGGVFDVYHKIKALKEKGVIIYLHCYDYGRGRQPELNKYCAEVYYYTRNEGHKGFSASVPYIVSSRANQELTNQLLKDNHPILAEGIHCTSFLNDERFSERKILLRLHNVEHEYYHQLYKYSNSLFKKVYYYNESRLLKNYEAAIANRIPILAMTGKDIHSYQEQFGAARIWQLPVFVGWDRVKTKPGLGTYCLYHGNLSVAENEKAAIWLLENIFNDLEIPFVIAGKNPSEKLEKIAHQGMHTCLVTNPAEDEMRDLISKAQINILPSFSETGIKLKLINALFNGRHCVVNERAVAQTGLEEICHVAEETAALKAIIIQLFDRPIEQEEIDKREQLLMAGYDNLVNADKLIAWIW
jgi:glycosyltransferase involved in cell wall biosynthesis